MAELYDPCIKCGKMASINRSGICKHCRTITCVKCKKEFLTNSNSVKTMCSSCKKLKPAQ